MKWLTLIFLYYSLCINAQESTSSWTTLAKVSYKKAYDDLLGISVDKPLFSKEIRNIEGKKIKLRGYIIPTDGFKSHKEFILSAFPYSSCFFCGQAGPETVVEVQANNPIEYSADVIELEGILRLNSTDINRMMYQITQVTRIK
ncbi:MAG: hypothetical protein ABIO44_00350 [Saprospiraceae bacterium]